MIRVSVLTTVWKRPVISNFHFFWMRKFKTQCKDIGIKLIPLYVLSNNDNCKDLYVEQLDRMGLSYVVVPKMRLSMKTQVGLAHLKEIHFDYLMHLDSDEILSLDLMRRWKQCMDKGTLWFGSASCYFVDNKTGHAWEFLRYSDHPVKNGGTCLNKEILQMADWELWPIQRDQGLNVMERRRIQDLGYNIEPIDTQDYYGVVEIKGGDSAIHNIDWFKKQRLLKELDEQKKKNLLRHHPMLGYLI